MYSAVSLETIEILSNDDGDSKDNVWLKIDLYFIYESRNKLEIFSV